MAKNVDDVTFREMRDLIGRMEQFFVDMSNSSQRPPLRDFYVARAPVVADVGEFSMTRQEFKDECDLNVLLAQYEKNGVWPPPLPGVEPQYLDVSEVPDLMGALEYMSKAEAAFMALPAKVRREFDNDPLRFVEFAENGENIGKMREWGLAPPAAARGPTSDSPPGQVPAPQAPGAAPVPPGGPPGGSAVPPGGAAGGSR